MDRTGIYKPSHTAVMNHYREARILVTNAQPYGLQFGGLTYFWNQPELCFGLI